MSEGVNEGKNIILDNLQFIKLLGKGHFGEVFSFIYY
jgi:hypothetical protein